MAKDGILDIVIPALNAAAHLGATLASLEPARRAGMIGAIILVDGGSRDGTPALARKAGARVVSTPAGRGHQLRAGAETSRSPWLLFLHADTRLAPGWEADAGAFIAEASGEEAAVFTLRMDDAAPAARRLERLVAWRTRRLGLPYGDQGLLIPRRFYDTLGGFGELSLMEDVDLARRIGRRRLRLLPSEALTGAERYRAEGYLKRGFKNLAILTLYFCGVAPARLARLYDRPPAALGRAAR